MSKQDEIFDFWTENSGLTRETALKQAVDKYNVTFKTVFDYYPVWKKQFMKPKHSPIGQLQTIKTVQAEEKESKPALDVLNTNPTLQKEIEAIVEEKAKSKAVISKEEYMKVYEPAESENSASRLAITKTVEIEGAIVFFTSVEPSCFTIKDTITEVQISITELDDLIDELTELRSELRKTDI